MSVSRMSPAHLVELTCNALWGSQLSFTAFSPGQPPVSLHRLWPDDHSLVATYREAGLEQCSYEVCTLLLASGSFKALEALVKAKVVSAAHVFAAPGNPSLAHLVCVLCLQEGERIISRTVNGTENGIWSKKDDGGRLPEDVCTNQELCRKIPHRSLFGKRRMPVAQSLRSGDADRIFQLAANHQQFYPLLVDLKTHIFDVNEMRNSDGKLLIHIAVSGGLLSLPLLFTLVNHFKADVNGRDSHGLTALGLACQLGYMRVAEVLVCVLGANLNSRDTALQRTALHFAVFHNHPDTVSMLLRRGANPCSEDVNSCDPTHLSRVVGAHECRQLLLHHIRERMASLATQTVLGTLVVSSLNSEDVYLTDEDGCTLLMLAAKHGHAHLIKELVKMKNCPLDFRQTKTPNLLGQSMELSASLRSLPQCEEHAFKTALHYAAEYGHSTCVLALLEAHAHPALPDGKYWLPLHHACEGEHVECVRVILGQRRTLGLSGLKLATSIACDHDNQRILEILMEAAARRQSELVTPVLFDVAVSGSPAILHNILQDGDNVNPTNEASDWPLLLAAGFGYLEIVTYLYQYGGKVMDTHPITGSTPLHLAARGGHEEVVNFLLQFTIQGGRTEGGLDINFRNRAGATPLELAASQGHSKMVQLLLDAGASCCLPDSNNRLLVCPAFEGTHHLLIESRKERMKKLSAILEKRQPLKELQAVWQGPWDFNLCSESGDTLLMVAAQHALPEVLKFLLVAASLGKPGMFPISSGTSPLFVHSVTTSPGDSDPIPRHCTSLLPPPPHHTHHIRHGYSDPRQIFSDSISSTKPRQRRYTATRYDSEANSTKPRQRRYIDSRLRRSCFPSLPPLPLSRRHVHVKRNALTSGEEEEEEEESDSSFVMATPLPIDSAVCSAVVRLTNPHNGKTALHRAAEAGQAQNMLLLVKADKEAVNDRDSNGDTPLHLACRRAQGKEYRRTVEALLSSDKVNVMIRNRSNQLPEEDCPSSWVRKMVVKRRPKEFGKQRSLKILDLPTPPGTVCSGGEISEGATPTRSYVSELSFTTFDNKLKHFKECLESSSERDASS